MKDFCEMMDIPFTTIKGRLNVMEIKPDIQIEGINYYSESTKNRIMGVYEFEKNAPEIIYFECNNKYEKFDYFESKANSIDEKETELLASSFEQEAKEKEN